MCKILINFAALSCVLFAPWQIAFCGITKIIKKQKINGKQQEQ